MSEKNGLFATESQVGTEDAVEEISKKKFLIFESDGLRFGTEVNYVVEILTSHIITRLPVVPDYVRGIINLRGQIIPIIDIRLRLGKPPREDCLIIVLDVEGTQMGILVDFVAQMEDVADMNILPMPANNTQKLVSGMCTLQDGSTMLVLDCALLLE